MTAVMPARERYALILISLRNSFAFRNGVHKMLKSWLPVRQWLLLPYKRGVAQLGLERCVRDAEVAGSNPVAPIFSETSPSVSRSYHYASSWAFSSEAADRNQKALGGAIVQCFAVIPALGFVRISNPHGPQKHIFYINKLVRRVAKVNYAMTICAHNCKVLHTSLCGVFNIGEGC